ncbi:MAG: molybdopterin-guanine dinucleotide biosynthesis protein B, partial [Thermoplasmatales archaeon]|nr:molybdopterin-guanine dinucleotide biosynthesis protein B [Thermoplasmatales archaeon]
MSVPAIFGFYGSSNTGKTTLIVKIIEKLTKEGYKVATIKKTDKKIDIDKKDKDTWKHGQAGARLVVLSSSHETDFIVKENMKIDDIIQNISEMGYYDAIIVEGARDSSIPKIRLGDMEERDNTIGYYQDNFEEIFKLIKKEIDKKTVFDNQDIGLRVNKKIVPLSEFPADIIKNGILGM